MSLKSEKHENIYKYIENNFKHKFFDFNYPKNNKDIMWDYYKILNEYLKNHGYGYIYNQIGKFIDKKEVNNIELAKLLMDCNLINKYNKSIKSDIENKSIIKYEKRNGFTQSYKIKYSNTILLNIDNVFYRNTSFISHKINNDKKEITININIKPGKIVNFTEIISIYTNYGVDKLEFTIITNEKKSEDFEIETLEEFLGLCETNHIKAKEIFYKLEFEKWLHNKNNITQIINYNQSVKISDIKNDLSDRFRVFCRLNGIYNIEEYIDEEKYEYDNLDTTMNLADSTNIIKENILNEIKEDIKTEENNINKKETVSKINENKEQGMLSGFKKVIGSLFKRK